MTPKTFTHHDALKRPCVVGDRVLTKGYGSCNMDTVATITKMTKGSVFIEVPAAYWQRTEDPTSAFGYTYTKVTSETKVMKRDSSSFVVINEQLKHNYETYPELYI